MEQTCVQGCGTSQGQPAGGAREPNQRSGADASVYPSGYVLGAASGIDAELIKQLRCEFLSESAGAGVCLAMARGAERQGKIQVAQAFYRCAENAQEHAARLAELLGERLSPSPAYNLAARIEAAHDASERKTEIARRAEALNLDAIHDALHEMARADAHFGAMLEALLKEA